MRPTTHQAQASGGGGERARARESLRSSETRYRRLFEAARDGILIVDTGCRKITDVNPYMSDLLGYPPAAKQAGRGLSDRQGERSFLCKPNRIERRVLVERHDGVARRLDQATERPTDREIVVHDRDQRRGQGHQLMPNTCLRYLRRAGSVRETMRSRRATNCLRATSAAPELIRSRDDSRTVVATGHQLVFGDLVEQGLVADLENPRRLGAIPVHPLEHFFKGFALGFTRPAACDLPQALGEERSGPRGRGVPVPTAGDQGLERLLPVREHHHASNDVLQLSDIARPRVLREAGHGLGRELLRPPVPLVEPREETRRQERNLLFPLPERGNADLYYVEAVVEVLSELATGHRVLEGPLRGGDHARVDLGQPVAPTRAKRKSWSTCRSLAWRTSGSSAISSR